MNDPFTLWIMGVATGVLIMLVINIIR